MCCDEKMRVGLEVSGVDLLYNKWFIRNLKRATEDFDVCGECYLIIFGYQKLVNLKSRSKS